MEEWRSYTTLSSLEKRKDMGPPSDPLRFVSSPKGNELTQKAVEMITISTLQRKELEKMRNQQHPSETEADWLSSLHSWREKRHASTLERRKDSDRDHIKSSLSNSIEKGRESGIGSSLFSPIHRDSFSSPSSNYVLTNFSPAIQPEKEKEKSELDQVLIQLQLLREKKERGEQNKDVPSRFTPAMAVNVVKTTWTDVNIEMEKKETSTVEATLHYAPKEIEKITRVEPPRKTVSEWKRMDKNTIHHEKMKKPTRMVVDIGLDDPSPPPPPSSSFSSHLRSSYRSSTLNPITPPILEPLSTLYPPSGESWLNDGGMRMYGSLPRRKDNDYRVISVDEKKGPGKLTDFVPDVDREKRNYENGDMRGSMRDEEPLLIRNYRIHPITTMDSRPKYKSIDEFDPHPINTIDSYSTLPSKWTHPVPTPSQGIGRSAQEWLSVTQTQKFPTPGVRRNGGNLVRKEFAHELQEKIVKKMEADEKSAKDRKRLPEQGTVSSKKLCADCGVPLGNGNAMIIGSIDLSFHIRCFRCSQCGCSLDKNGSEGAQVQLSGGRLHCIDCYENCSL